MQQDKNHARPALTHAWPVHPDFAIFHGPGGDARAPDSAQPAQQILMSLLGTLAVGLAVTLG